MFSLSGSVVCSRVMAECSGPVFLRAGGVIWRALFLRAGGVIWPALFLRACGVIWPVFLICLLQRLSTIAFSNAAAVPQ